MKNKILLTLSLSALVLAGCSKSDRNETQAGINDAYSDTKAVVADAWSDLKDYTFEKRSDFTIRTEAMTAKLDAQVSELQANYAADKASASRQAAMEELKNSRADLNDKLAALGNASADTWASAKAGVIAAWDRTEAAYKKAKADNS